jgi:hypothetical protein
MGCSISPPRGIAYASPAPQSGQNVVIDHVVTLNNAIGVYGGTLTIHGQGALLQDGTPRSSTSIAAAAW